MAIAKTSVLDLEGCKVFKRTYLKAGDVSSRQGGNSPMFGFLVQGSIQITSDDILMPDGTSTYSNTVSTPGFLSKASIPGAKVPRRRRGTGPDSKFKLTQVLGQTLNPESIKNPILLRTALEDNTIMVAISPANELRPYEKRMFHMAAGEEITLNRRNLSLFYVAKGTVTVLGFDPIIEATVDTARKIPPGQNTTFKADEDTILIYMWQK